MWRRFWRARRMAWGEMSRPWMCREGVCGDRREESRRGMQPVPVQRSRMRREGGVGWARSRWARWVV